MQSLNLSAQIITAENQQYHEKSSAIVSGGLFSGSRGCGTVLSAIPCLSAISYLSDGMPCSDTSIAVPVPADQYSDL